MLFSTQQKPKNNAIALKKNVTKFTHLYIAFHLKKEKKIQYMYVNNYSVYHISSLRREMFKKSLTKYRLISKCFREGCFNTIKSIDAYILHA